MSFEERKVSAHSFNRGFYHQPQAICGICSFAFPLLLPLLLFALGKNSVVLILSACGLRESQALAEYNGGVFFSPQWLCF